MPDFKHPVLYPAFDRVNEQMVLKLPLGKDRKGNDRDFYLTYRWAKAIMKYADEIRDFVNRMEGK